MSDEGSSSKGSDSSEEESEQDGKEEEPEIYTNDGMMEVMTIMTTSPMTVCATDCVIIVNCLSTYTNDYTT